MDHACPAGQRGPEHWQVQEGAVSVDRSRRSWGFRSSESAPRGSAQSGPVLSLTQIQQQAKLEFARAKRYKFPLSVAICRIDRIDSLADLYGQDSRTLLMDELIKLYACRGRMTDILGRMGEDRLLWILPHTEMSGARVAAERIRRGVEELEMLSGKKILRVRLSIGLAAFVAGDTLFLDSLVYQAERALERAQDYGGNRVEEHVPPGAQEPGPATGEARDSEDLLL